MRQKIELYDRVEDAKKEADKLAKFSWFVHTIESCEVKGGEVGFSTGDFEISSSGDHVKIVVVYRNMGDGKELPIAKSKATDSKSTDDSTVPDDWFDDE